MNILFFLTPKEDVAHVDEDDTMRQVLEKMEHHGYTAIPLLSREGKYIGTITEGDLLWFLKDRNFPDLKLLEDMPITSIQRRRDNEAVKIDESMEDLFGKVMNQNFVPVVDDKRVFIGIVTRKDILAYLGKKAAAQAEAERYAKEQEAAGIRAVGEAEASAIQAKGIAEAEAMEKKAEAYAKYNKAAVAEMMIKVLPDIAAKVAEPLGQIDKITIIGGGEGGNGVDQVAGNVPVVMAKVFESMKEATGIDLADIINAESYDAQVNRNINVSGLDSVNLVVKDEKTAAGQPDAQDGATTE